VQYVVRTQVSPFRFEAARDLAIVRGFVGSGAELRAVFSPSREGGATDAEKHRARLFSSTP
jgi:hypothetical protein